MPETTETVIIAASERLARDLRLREAVARREEGVWTPSSIHSLRSWLLASWGSCWPKEQLLFPAQELAIWMYAIEKSGAGKRQISRMAATRQARQAGNLVITYGIDATPTAFDGPDESAFKQWFALVRESERENDWLLESEMPTALEALLAAREWQPPAAIELVGFIEESPVLTHLLDTLAQHGCTIQRRPFERACERILALRPATTATELEWVVKDAAKRLQARPIDSPPEIGIAVPDIEAARYALESVLGRYVSPHCLVPGDSRDRTPWRFARGRTLDQHPLVAAALDLVALERGHNDLAQVSRIVLDRRLFGGFPQAERAAYDLLLRRSGTRFALRRLHALCFKAEAPRTAFTRALSEWLTGYEQSTQGRHLPSAWADIVNTLLQRCGWGGATLSSEDQQAVDAWCEALDVLRAMDVQVGEIDHARLVVWLREIVMTRRFQPAVKHLQPIHILPYEDVPGSDFDVLYVLDATTGHLPAVTPASGYLSQTQLAAADVPWATPERALAHARRLCDAFAASSRELIYLAPVLDPETGAPLVASSLVQDWQAPDVEAPVETVAPCPLEAGPVETVAAVVDVAREGIRGGVGIFRATAVSPLLAFLRYRLGLSEFPDQVSGLDPRVQGDFVHAVLQRFWVRTRTRAALLQAIETDTLQASVAEAVAAAQRSGLASADAYGVGLSTLEAQRVTALVIDWLKMEARRELAFEVVATEVPIETIIGGIPLSLRLDRVDRIETPDGPRYLVIDYKTSSHLAPSHWDSQSLLDPQLPIYAAMIEPAQLGALTIDGIAWGQVHERGCQFVLLSNFAGKLVAGPRGTGKPTLDWDGRVAGWRATIAQLAAEFSQGDLSVNRALLDKDRFHADLDPLLRPSPLDDRAPDDTPQAECDLPF